MKYCEARKLICTLGLAATVFLLIGTPGRPCAAQSVDVTDSQSRLASRPIQRIDAGTMVFGDSDATSWNRAVLVATPKINSGDVDSLSETVRDAASECSLTLMATVKKLRVSPLRQQAAQNKAVQNKAVQNKVAYKLTQIGAGHSFKGPSGRVIVSSDSGADLGVSLGFLSRQVLKANEQRLPDVLVVAQTSRSAIFDAPSVMWRRDAHREYLTRHLIYVDQSTGDGGMLAWLLAPASDVPAKTGQAGSNEHLKIIDRPIRAVKWGTIETRNVHVDAEQFNFLGVPGELAFGVEDLPPGIDVNWTRRAAKVAGKKWFTAAELDELSAAMRQAMLTAN